MPAERVRTTDPHSRIHPAAWVEDGAQLGSGCVIHAHAVVLRHCVLGDGVEVHPFAVLGGPPQDLSAEPRIESAVTVGARTTIREHVTVNRASRAGQSTDIGADCFIMAAAHVAHDCRLGNHVVMANAVLLGGHVSVGDHAFLGGGAVVHQYCRIGESAMIGGGARISEDIAPFCLAAERNLLAGLNMVGLRRRGLSRNALAELKRAYQLVARQTGNVRAVAAAALLSGDFNGAEVQQFLNFLQAGTRRLARPSRAGSSSDAREPA